MEFLALQKEKYPNLSNHYDKMEEMFTKKLWHELTEVLESFVNDSANLRGDNFNQLHVEFISKFENRLSSVRFAQIVSVIGNSLGDLKRSIEYFQTVLASKTTKFTPEAIILIKMDIAVAQSQLLMKDESLVLLNEAWAEITAKGMSDGLIFSKYYYALSVHRKVFGPAHEFHKSALMYLVYTDITKISSTVRYNLAYDLCLAAISSEEIYSFGEVVSSPVFSSLSGTSMQWLSELVLALNEGDMTRFVKVIDSNRAQYNAIPVLAGNESAIKQKVVLLNIMNTVFARDSHDRTVSFTDLAESAKIPLNEVEWALMKAMSLNLIRGSMDEVKQQIHVSYVRPKVLNIEDLQLVSEKLDKWASKAKNALLLVEEAEV